MSDTEKIQKKLVAAGHAIQAEIKRLDAEGRIEDGLDAEVARLVGDSDLLTEFCRGLQEMLTPQEVEQGSLNWRMTTRLALVLAKSEFMANEVLSLLQHGAFRLPTIIAAAFLAGLKVGKGDPLTAPAEFVEHFKREVPAEKANNMLNNFEWILRTGNDLFCATNEAMAQKSSEGPQIVGGSNLVH